jgi:hypothetical protein
MTAGRVEHDRALGNRPGGRHLGAEAEAGEHLDAVGRQRQACAGRLQVSGALEHGDAHTVLLQRDRECQAADTGPGDHHIRNHCEKMLVQERPTMIGWKR